MAHRSARVAAAMLGAAATVAVSTRRRWRDWGATADEAERELAGDGLLCDPTVVTTRAVSILAPASAIWPWLVQIGPGRAGAYTYDWIENLFGLRMHSSEEILPQFQHLEVGDTQQLGARGPILRVALADPTHALVLCSDDGNWVWSFVLLEDRGVTRLLSRNRIRAPGATWGSRAIYREVMVPASLVMEHKMLLGIKARAERLAGALRHAPGEDSLAHDASIG